MCNLEGAANADCRVDKSELVFPLNHSRLALATQKLVPTSLEETRQGTFHHATDAFDFCTQFVYSCFGVS